jgi:hypothetical protein
VPEDPWRGTDRDHGRGRRRGQGDAAHGISHGHAGGF